MAEEIYESYEGEEPKTETREEPASDLDIQGAIDYAQSVLRERQEKNPEYTKERLAEEIGLGKGNTAGSKLSQFIAGKYGSPHTVLEKINRYRNLEHKRRYLPEAPPFVMTTVSKIVFGQICYAQERRQPVMIYGDAGIGKTSAVREFQRQFPDDVIEITASPAFDEPHRVYQILIDALDIHKSGRIKQRKAILEELGSGQKVVILDEAQFWSAKTIEELRILCEDANVGLVLIGNYELHDRMHTAARADKYSRVDSRVKSKEVSRKRIKKSDTEMIFADYGLKSEEIDELHDTAKNTNKSVRGSVKILQDTIMAHGSSFTTDNLKARKREFLDV